MRRLDVQHVRAMATSASRDAGNAGELVAALAKSGIVAEVIEGAREAELTFLGATSARAGEGILVVDCGGGSTELVLGDVAIEDGVRTGCIAAARSIDVGSRRLTEMYLHSDPPTRSELADAREWTVAEMRAYFERLDERPRQMVAVAGTATTLASIELGLVEYDSELVDGSVLSGSQVAETLEMLAGMPQAKRLQVTGLHPGRAGVIVAGALILETVMALAGVDAMVVSERDILCGILIDTYRHLRES
jgi:exopolyphosphatase/guanosine-5'-triphosphate,3'-diphosphate pyrophosphatase